MKFGYITYRGALKRLFNTEDGKLVLAYWDMTHNKSQMFNKDELVMAGNARLKDFIQGVLNDVNDPRAIEELQQQLRSYEND